MKVLPIERRVQMSSDAPPVKASCGWVVLAMTSFHFGEVVAMPRLPVKKESAVVVEMREPTVS